MSSSDAKRDERVEPGRRRVQESGAPFAWFDTANITDFTARDGIFKRAFHHYAGVVLYPHNVEAVAPTVPDRVLKILHVDRAEHLAALSSLAGAANVVVSSEHVDVLALAGSRGVMTCYRTNADGASMDASISRGAHDYVMVRFRDPVLTSELVASLRDTETILVTELGSDGDGDGDAVALDAGAGVMFSPRSLSVLNEFLARLGRIERVTVSLDVASIVKCTPIGMGYRSCIDTTSIFSETEGILVGSTSQGGLLCCAEVFFLPYMELRPFRVNAGAIHSYVYNFENRTDYMSELRAGSPVMLVDGTGTTRRSAVGRMKTEVRPLRLIEAEFATGERINTIMQDDWHVRIFSDDARPLNITELRPGDRVLGHIALPGRHVGIKVDEHILET